MNSNSRGHSIIELSRIKLPILASIDHLEAAAEGDPGRAGLAYACMLRALDELDAAQEGSIDDERGPSTSDD